MTIGQFNEKYEELVNRKDLKDYLLRCMDNIVAHGCCNIDDAEDDFRLPKIALSAALISLADQYLPPHGENEAKKVRKNILYFV